MDKIERSALIKSVVSFVRELITERLRDVVERLDAHTTRIQTLEQHTVIDGKDGKDGSDGAPGIDGKDGRDGIDGKDGVPGLNGKDGLSGERGLDGIAGRDGINGIDGKDGANGLDGKDGEHGADGAAGRDGVNGINGKDGVDGRPGEQGAQGLMGVQGERGIDGRDGREGKDGRDGAAGRDAIDLTILTNVDESKTYELNTYAHRHGGLMRRTLDGWTVIVEGISDVAIENEERTFLIRCTLTSGKQYTKSIQLPVLIYREVFKAGTPYVRGDVCTYSGCSWHCQVDETKQTPGTGADWQMMVRNGRNGKDGKDGARGEPGPIGATGRDLTQMSPNGGKY